MTAFDGPERLPASGAGRVVDRIWNSAGVMTRCWIIMAPVVYAIDLLQQTRDGLSDGVRRPFGDDFVNYWSGAFLASHGRTAEVYDFRAFHAFEASITGPHIDYYHYSYPPVLLLLTLPLAAVSYVPALGVWLATTWYGFYRSLLLTGGDDILLLSLATPALFVNALGGQNGALTAALLGGGLSLTDRRPLLAGVLFGLLAYKPHLGLMLPVALLAGRRWSALTAAAVMGVLLVSASIFAFGVDPWMDYIKHLAPIRTIILEDGTGVWHRMLSVFVFARRLGAGVEAAYALQAVSAVIAAACVIRSWLRDDPPHLRNAMVVVGTFLATPYLQDYDLVVGAFVVIWLLAEARHAPARLQPIRAAIMAILTLPLITAPLGKATGLACGPIIFVPLLVLLECLASERGCAPIRRCAG
jgi:arabinofuranan 3-O-arabinosyltransferase